MNVPRLVIAAPMSGSGKTTITAGLIAAFAARGLRIAPFKVGPDYIDPSYHALAAGRPSYNLDTWLLPADRVQTLFAYRSQHAHLAIIEGMMGLFDGQSADDDQGSAAHIARLLGAPVLLVVDANAMATSAAALVKGFHDFDPRVNVAGVILNRVGSEGHARWLQTAIERHVGVPVLGYLVNDAALNLPERHLGLIPTLEPGHWQPWLDAVRQKVAACFDLEKILGIARSTPPLEISADDPFKAAVNTLPARIAVARDAAFNFLYDDNLDLLRAAGAEIVFFSPLNDCALPAGSEAIYLCGGFPELYAAELSANSALYADIRAAFAAGLPIYAECGGLMYLTEEIIDAQDKRFPMVGLLRGKSVMTPRLTIGYRTVCTRNNSWLWDAQESIRGHEFHYSTWVDRPAELPAAYSFANDAATHEGAQIGSLIASYVHLHFLANPELAQRMVKSVHGVTAWQPRS